MRPHLLLLLALSVLLNVASAGAAAVGRAGPTESHVVIAVQATGAVSVTNDLVQPRAMMERMVRMMERYAQDSTSVGEDTAAGITNAAPKPFTDEELAAKVRAAAKKNAGIYDPTAPEPLIARIEVTSNTVHSVSVLSYPSLREFLAHVSSALMQAGLSMETVRFETTNDQLQVAFVPVASMKRYLKNVREQWKTSGNTREFKLLLPGKIIRSDFPQTEGNATSIVMSPDDDASLDAFSRIYTNNTLVIAELGGLKVDRPLSSRTLQRAARRPSTEAAQELPISDAGPGFLAEASAVTTSSTYVFPEGAKFIRDEERMMLQTGTVVRARLFAPKGRTIQVVSDVRVLAAIDDKGRALSPTATAGAGARTDGSASAVEGEGQDDAAAAYTSYSMGGQDKGSTMIELRTALPAPDATLIGEIKAQAVVTTAGKWNELTLTNLQAGQTNTIDLATVVPGATLRITKFATRDQQTTLDAELRGPKQVRQIKLECKWAGPRSGQSSMNERKSSVAGDQVTREVQVMMYSYDGGASAGERPVNLVVRYPVDLRRERVTFTLSTLDLF